MESIVYCLPLDFEVIDGAGANKLCMGPLTAVSICQSKLARLPTCRHQDGTKFEPHQL